MSNRILLADDSITIQKVVNLTFSDEGFEIVTVGNGELALRKLEEASFDLVLADIFMPGRNGYEVCEYVKSSPAHSHIPVILLVGAFEPFDRSEAARVRADGHLTKPFESRILVETVKRLLASAPARPAAPVADAWAAPPVSAPLPPQEEGEPEPPPYDPYASTAKLPPLNAVIGQGDSATMGMGAPFRPEPEPETTGAQPAPSGGLFQFDMSAPLNIEPLPSAAEFEAPSIDFTTRPSEPLAPPPPEIPDFGVAVEVAPPAVEEAPPVAPPVEEAPPAPPVVAPPPVEAPAPAPAPQPSSYATTISYKSFQPGDSPLDLPDFGTVEPNTYAPVEVAEVRDPLLETFADVAAATSQVEAAPTPGLEGNEQPEEPAQMHVRPIEVMAPWEQPELPAAHEGRDTSRMTSFSPITVPMEPTEMPPVEASPAAAEAEPASWDVAPATQVYAPYSPPPAAFEAGAEEPVEAAPVEEPVESIEDFVRPYEEGAEEEAAAVSGNGAAPIAIPDDLIEEVVRRTVARMSDEVIREIAWEVVPDLAEIMIRKHLSEHR